MLDAAAALFATSGYTATRTCDVAAAAETSKPVLYGLFGSKHALYRAVLDREHTFVRRMVVRPMAQDPASNLWSTSARIAARFWHLQTRRPSALPVLLGSQDWRVENEYKTALRAELEEFVERSVRTELVGVGAEACSATFAARLLTLAVSTCDLLREGRADRAGVRDAARNTVLLFGASWTGMSPGAAPLTFTCERNP